jgi:hypothetical protein
MAENNDTELLRIAEEYHQASLQAKPPEKVLKRWKYAHEQMINHFRFGKDLQEALMDKFDIGAATARLDIQNANNFFLSQDDILSNIDFYRMLLFKWQLKGVALAYKKNEIKEFNSGIKNLYLILGLNKAKDGMDPKLFKQQIVNNFHIDARKFSHVEVNESDVIEFIENIDELSPHEKAKLKRDAKILGE